MLSEEKIRLMNEIAAFEKKYGRREREADTFFRGDYVAKYILQSFVTYTLSFILLLGLMLLYRLEDILNTVNVMDVLLLGRRCVVFYAAGLIIFEAVTIAVSLVRYHRAQKLRDEYLVRLNRLNKGYDLADRTKYLSREGGRNA